MKQDAKDKGMANAGMANGFAGALFANQVRATAANAGLAGMAAGLVFNALIRRSPAGAIAMGAAILGYQAWHGHKERQAKRDAQQAAKREAMPVGRAKPVRIKPRPATA
jgi:hypothetical protein